MIKWIAISTLLIAGLILWFVFQRLGENPLASAPLARDTITIMHSYKDGVHRYKGALRLPHSCYDQLEPEVSINSRTPDVVMLNLVTRDKMLDQRLCLQLPTIYPFEEYVEAPDNATLILRVHGIDMPTKIIDVTWQNPRGTILNLENNP